MKKPWKRSIENGIEIPTEKNKFETKKFSSKINLLKRQAPDENYIMHPYDDTCVIQDIYNKIIKENNLDLLMEDPVIMAERRSDDEEGYINETHIDYEENDIEND